jgi:hypothetical protein
MGATLHLFGILPICDTFKLFLNAISGTPYVKCFCKFISLTIVNNIKY